jgi:hypothetical protein
MSALHLALDRTVLPDLHIEPICDFTAVCFAPDSVDLAHPPGGGCARSGGVLGRRLGEPPRMSRDWPARPAQPGPIAPFSALVEESTTAAMPYESLSTANEGVSLIRCKWPDPAGMSLVETGRRYTRCHVSVVPSNSPSGAQDSG